MFYLSPITREVLRKFRKNFELTFSDVVFSIREIFIINLNFNIMEVLLILLAFAVVLVVFLFFWLKRIKKIVKMNSDKVVYAGSFSSGYTGLGDEPFWNGNLSSSVDDYEVPRYVYENLAESVVHKPENGRVVGYRISPTLVIHSMVGGDDIWSKEDALGFIKKYGGKFLEEKDVAVLRQNWSTIDAMRTAIGDTELPRGWFWLADVPAHSVEDRFFPFPTRCNIILKR